MDLGGKLGRSLTGGGLMYLEYLERLCHISGGRVLVRAGRVPPVEVGGATLAWGESKRGACLVVEAVRGVRSVRRRFGKPVKRMKRGLICGGGKCESLGSLLPL